MIVRKRSIVLCLMGVGLCLASTVWAGENVHWGYSGHEGPEFWGKLHPDFSHCSEGKNQAPINLTGMMDGDLSPLTVNYLPGGNEIINNGHTIKVDYSPGSTFTIDGHQYELKQFHFHTPSENWINDQSYPMEAHFVHTDKSGNIAVIALMFKAGDKNPELEKAWEAMPEKSEHNHKLAKTVNAKKLLPHALDYYRFNGSLTTPPCSEGVLWIVMKESVTASKEQIEKFSHAMPHPNNRPVQPKYARVVLK